MYDADRHLGSLANQLYRARDELRTAQLQLQRARSKKKGYKRGLRGRTRALQTAYNRLGQIQHQLTDLQNTRTEVRTIAIRSYHWYDFPQDEQAFEQRLWLARRLFNRDAPMGTRIKWFRAHRTEWSQYAAVPERPGTQDYGGTVTIWLTLQHKWDDRNGQRHTDDQWRAVANHFCYDIMQRDEISIHGFNVLATT